jgi:cyclic pyranopterin phosphate synthase
MAVLDTFGRPLRSLRISVTDRCNIRCAYCMPEAEYVWLPRQDLLAFEEIGRLVDAFVPLGVERVRLTGGEPLLRRDLPRLVASIAQRPGIRDLALTTNGVLLAGFAPALKAAGLHRVTVSLDTLHRDRYQALTRFDALGQVLAGVAAARAAFDGLKLDSVIIRGVNDDEIAALVAFGREWRAEVRFIEYMDVGGATRWTRDQVVSRAEILERLETAFGRPVPLPAEGAAPAERFRLPDGTVVGIIASTTAPFCRTCDRARLTADGTWLLCLYATTGLDLRGPLRAGASDADLRRLVSAAWARRSDRGAEERLALREQRTALVPAAELRRNRHLEMHTRGG